MTFQFSKLWGIFRLKKRGGSREPRSQGTKRKTSHYFVAGLRPPPPPRNSLKQKEEVRVISCWGAEVHRPLSSSQASLSKGWEHIQLPPPCPFPSATPAFDSKTCFTSTPCTSGHAHFFLQNRFLLQMLASSRASYPVATVAVFL